MNVLFVPSIGLDISLLERLAASVDYPVKNKVVLNNGHPGALNAFADAHRDWLVKESDFGNLGVAGSWNHCAEMFPDEPCWLIMNEDAWFLPGYLEKICKCADRNHNAPLIFLNDSTPYYCFVWTAAGLRTCGAFDINFWPAYHEDCDMNVRHRKMGITSFPLALEDLTPLPHGKDRSGGINYTAMLQGAGLLNRSYWLRKWGPNDEYNTPYRDPRLQVKEWVWDRDHRDKIVPLWEAFMEFPNPSIYD